MFGKKGETLDESPAVDEFFDRLSHLEGVALLTMAGERAGTPQERLDQARAQAVRTAQAAGLSEQLAKVEGRALHWASRPESSYTEFISVSMWNPLWTDAKAPAGPAIVDAAVAIALGDRLDPSASEILLRPWYRALEAASAESREAGR